VTLIPALLAAAVVAGALTIWADYRTRYALVYVFKPLTMAALIDVALILAVPGGSGYGRWILAGLALALAGDILLMLKKKRFIEGLVCFLIAHVFYSAAFLSRMHGRLSVWPTLPVALFALAVFLYLRPHLGKMKIPVAAYMIIISAMAWLAAERFMGARTAAAALALAGAVLFLASDASLAVNRFVRKRRFGQLLTLGTYFAAQALIALSIGS
jgi:uncharacterized membrane protein YhhN